ncbi:hypothetical protein AAG747_21085 [Rapidithrix thailandica]|uniref:Uncharacterized protein n=1 Tax=Rapidithrix thailandica TaxID=413964 RepID=A0AAW9S2U9_9BACT
MNISKYYPLLLKVVCWILFANYFFGIFTTIYVDYLSFPELIGEYYLPVDFFSEVMLSIYLILTFILFFSTGIIGVLLSKKWGWYLMNVLYVGNLLYYLYHGLLYKLQEVYITNWVTYIIELAISATIILLLNSKEVRSTFNLKAPFGLKFLGKS